MTKNEVYDMGLKDGACDAAGIYDIYGPIVAKGFDLPDVVNSTEHKTMYRVGYVHGYANTICRRYDKVTNL